MFAWTIFGYYGDPIVITNDQMHCTWYIVDNFGDLVLAEHDAKSHWEYH